MPGLKQRARTLVELADSAAFYVATRPLPLDGKAAKVLEGPVLQGIGAVAERLAPDRALERAEAIEAACRETAEVADVPLGKTGAGAARGADRRTTVSPGLFEVLRVAGPRGGGGAHWRRSRGPQPGRYRLGLVYARQRVAY